MISGRPLRLNLLKQMKTSIRKNFFLAYLQELGRKEQQRHWYNFIQLQLSAINTLLAGPPWRQSLCECQWPKNLIHFQTTKLIRLFSSRRNIYVDDLNGLYHSCPAHAFVLAVDALALLLSPGPGLSHLNFAT